MTLPHLLVVAKAPVPGRVKTRLGAQIGMEGAATLAAASLADTVETCTATYGAARCCLALDGTLDGAVAEAELSVLLEGWQLFAQRGDGLAARLVNAHADAGDRTGGAVVQVGMDTPHLTPELLSSVADGLTTCDAVLGPAEDGGWWVLAARDPRAVAAIAAVPMSTPTTGRETRRALESAGLRVLMAATLRDVDTVEDADAVAALAPQTRFGAAWEPVRRSWGRED
jgi:uncharacterized protein